MGVGLTVRAEWPDKPSCSNCPNIELYYEAYPEHAANFSLAMHHLLSVRGTSPNEKPAVIEKRQKALEHATSLIMTSFGETEGSLWLERMELIATSYSQLGMRCEPCPLEAIITKANK